MYHVTAAKKPYTHGRKTALSVDSHAGLSETAALDFASASHTAAVAAALAGMPPRKSPSSSGSAPLSSAETKAAQPASVTWVLVSPPVVVVGAPAGGDGATRAARPSSPNGLPPRSSCSSAGRRRRAGARAMNPASPMAALTGHGRQRTHAQPRRQPLHAIGAGCLLDEGQRLERWQHRTQRAQQRQVVRGEALALPPDILRLAQLLAAPQPQLEAQCCGSLMIGSQLLQQCLYRRP
eukprot:scaffold116654_cov60-Phaeocystis_antarctica.AAC.3